LALSPLDAIAVDVRLPDDRSFEELAVAAGLPPHALYGDVFTLSEAQDESGSGACLLSADGDGCRFQPNWLRSKRRSTAQNVGIFRSHADHEHALGLAYRGRALGWQRVARGDTAVEFELTPEDLRATLAQLSFQVIDKHTKSALPSATARLHAVDATSQRTEFNALALDSNARARVEALLPGDYQLVVGRDGMTEHRTRIALVAGTSVDLGAIELDVAAPLAVFTLDRDGAALAARIEIGAYVAGAPVADAFEGRVFLADDFGLARLPAPSTIAVVRATYQTSPVVGAGSGLLFSDVRRVDPEHLPRRLELVLRERQLITLSARYEHGRVEHLRIESLDGVTLARGDEHELAVYLPPARYRAVVVAHDGAEVAAREFDANENAMTTLALP
jgi:hypothetical protein